ncbi:MAG: hypothetical protein P4M00_22020 [Azospirillaceae bacterium]|nr:hypothetical protein [Azospirillaceae bacterium]
MTTRLGEQDRRVELPPGTLGPFGTPISALAVPAHLLRREPLESEPRIHAEAGTVTLDFDTATLVYDRMGLRRAPDETSK